MRPSARLLLVVAACAVLLATASPAKAETFTISNALGNCVDAMGNPSGCLDGLTYTLTVTGSGTDFTVTLTIVVDSSFVAPTTGPNKTPVNAIQAVNFNVISGDYVSQTLTAAPTGDPSMDWTTTNNNLSNSGCSDNSNTNFVCSEADAGFYVSLTPGATLTWTWDIVIDPANSLFPNLAGAHLGVKHNNIDGGVNGFLLSHETTPIPEPGTMALFGTGLLGLAGAIRRRMNS